MEAREAKVCRKIKPQAGGSSRVTDRGSEARGLYTKDPNYLRKLLPPDPLP